MSSINIDKDEWWLDVVIGAYLQFKVTTPAGYADGRIGGQYLGVVDVPWDQYNEGEHLLIRTGLGNNVVIPPHAITDARVEPV